LSTLLEDLYDALRKEMPDALRLVETAAKEGNVTSLRHEVHQLTGNFDVMGARRLALLCRTIGDAVKGGRPDEAQALIAEIPAHFESFCAAVEAFMARARG
ncbi:MAG TPA: Hpt domain-containing protein, partial [Candidatus Methylacidiphilales bacterium]